VNLSSVHQVHTKSCLYHVSPTHVPISHAALHHLKVWLQTAPNGYSPSPLGSRFPNDGESQEWHQRNASHLQPSFLRHLKYYDLYNQLLAFHGYSACRGRHHKAHTYQVRSALRP